MDASETVAQTLPVAAATNLNLGEWLVPAFAKVRQEQDCLYLHCREDSPQRLVMALAGGSALALRAEGIAHIKLYGSRWALGVDLPLGEAAVAAAAIAEKLVAHPALQDWSFKLLLRLACLSVLCEGEPEPVQAPTALAILAILRGTAGVEYLQNLVVKGRHRHQKRAAWTFEVDLLALGIEGPLPPSRRWEARATIRWPPSKNWWLRKMPNPKP
ncbi:MAG: hypothetical protein HC918_08560 [Oscillatoriales cyanobacterium SM2_1_8]|nr:hypothetical protein [Oscillatoriales cyanobacterium SM2_1_8]